MKVDKSVTRAKIVAVGRVALGILALVGLAALWLSGMKGEPFSTHWSMPEYPLATYACFGVLLGVALCLLGVVKEDFFFSFPTMMPMLLCGAAFYVLMAVIPPVMGALGIGYGYIEESSRPFPALSLLFVCVVPVCGLWNTVRDHKKAPADRTLALRLLLISASLFLYDIVMHGVYFASAFYAQGIWKTVQEQGFACAMLWRVLLLAYFVPLLMLIKRNRRIGGVLLLAAGCIPLLLLYQSAFVQWNDATDPFALWHWIGRNAIPFYADIVDWQCVFWGMIALGIKAILPERKRGEPAHTAPTAQPKNTAEQAPIRETVTPERNGVIVAVEPPEGERIAPLEEQRKGRVGRIALGVFTLLCAAGIIAFWGYLRDHTFVPSLEWLPRFPLLFFSLFGLLLGSGISILGIVKRNVTLYTASPALLCAVIYYVVACFVQRAFQPLGNAIRVGFGWSLPFRQQPYFMWIFACVVFACGLYNSLNNRTHERKIPDDASVTLRLLVWMLLMLLPEYFLELEWIGQRQPHEILRGSAFGVTLHIAMALLADAALLQLVQRDRREGGAAVLIVGAICLVGVLAYELLRYFEVYRHLYNASSWMEYLVNRLFYADAEITSFLLGMVMLGIMAVIPFQPVRKEMRVKAAW